MIPFVDLQLTYGFLREATEKVIASVIRDGNFILGPELQSFESEFANFIGVKHGIGVSSGTEALHLALRAAGIGPGDEVITVSCTFASTVTAIRTTGATPVFADIDNTFTMDTTSLESLINTHTKVILPVHLYGLPADMDTINDIAARHGLLVVEDAAQAHGASINGRRTGGFGLAGCFSFYPSKNLGACGDAGLITTDDDELALKLRALRHMGQTAKNYHQYLGFNSRMHELQAAILRLRLPHLENMNQFRQDSVNRYRLNLSPLIDKGQIAMQQVKDGYSHVYHILAVIVEGNNPRRSRDGLYKYLTKRGIGCGIHYPVPVHLQPAERDLGICVGSLPVTESLALKELSLPIYPGLSTIQIDSVAEAITEYFS